MKINKKKSWKTKSKNISCNQSEIIIQHQLDYLICLVFKLFDFIFPSAWVSCLKPTTILSLLPHCTHTITTHILWILSLMALTQSPSPTTHSQPRFSVSTKYGQQMKKQKYLNWRILKCSPENIFTITIHYWIKMWKVKNNNNLC